MISRPATLFATLFVLTLPGVASNSAHKTPYYRPKGSQQKQQKAATKPRASSGPVVVNAASYLPGVSPGGLVTIFGQDLIDVQGVIYADSNPFPNSLAGVSVQVNGEPAPLYAIGVGDDGQDQISVQVPYDAATGSSAVEITVYDSGQQVAEFTADSYTEDPGIFTYDNNDAIAQSGTDYSLIGQDNAAIPGDYLVLYTTGLGPLSVTLTDGYGAPSDPLAYTVDSLQVLLDNEQCSVYFSGLSPGLIGLYQVNFQVPADAASGNLNLQIQTPYAQSNVATLPVQ